MRSGYGHFGQKVGSDELDSKMTTVRRTIRHTGRDITSVMHANAEMLVKD